MNEIGWQLHVLRERFWIWLYKTAQKHLPPNYYDRLLFEYLREKMKKLAGHLGDDFVVWFVNEVGAAVPEMIDRELRDTERDFHYPR